MRYNNSTANPNETCKTSISVYRFYTEIPSQENAFYGKQTFVVEVKKKIETCYTQWGVLKDTNINQFKHAAFKCGEIDSLHHETINKDISPSLYNRILKRYKLN
jgi:hypothetical protein